MRFFVGMLVLSGLFLVPLRAVEGNLTNGTFNYDDPSVGTPGNPSGSVPGWSSASTTSSATGWSYVGVVNGAAGAASGTYLGNGWVITAGHVGGGTFVLNGVTYNPVSDSGVSIYNADSSQADIFLYQVTPPDGSSLPDLPALTLATTAPSTFSYAVMIGYGNATSAESWGRDRVSGNNYTVQVNGFTTTDFYAITGNAQDPAVLVGGDSGGGDFIYDSSKGIWTLAGINEAIGTSGNNSVSFMVQLSTYSSQINGIIGAPEPASWALLGAGLFLLACLRRFVSLPRRS